MKKYIAPEINNLELSVNDIIQTSNPEPPIQETIEYLGRRGLNIGGINAVDLLD